MNITGSQTKASKHTHRNAAQNPSTGVILVGSPVSVFACAASLQHFIQGQRSPGEELDGGGRMPRHVALHPALPLVSGVRG